jgi:hypothetical protein
MAFIGKKRNTCMDLVAKPEKNTLDNLSVDYRINF